ncbi:hypothetical protein [Actinoplanes lobatus]|uniref:Low-affinity inorganic phosphate transporter n=1 Tax=Actinoplanes lobatus TaxID=113568 RepID=A0A7W7MJD8_9ACTN|nr:hypothetical protein [Actinoplanes lobatus]MBB4751965.1 hypothetical protein [Actinoplanes lobatus]
MTETAVLIVLVVVTALAFDFTNGFHDTTNAMATSVATGAAAGPARRRRPSVLDRVSALIASGGCRPSRRWP